MPRPMASHCGKVTEFRTDLDSLIRNDPDGFEAQIARVKAIYRSTGSVAKTAKHLEIGKRTLERAIKDYPALRKAINEARVTMGGKVMRWIIVLAMLAGCAPINAVAVDIPTPWEGPCYSCDYAATYIGAFLVDRIDTGEADCFVLSPPRFCAGEDGSCLPPAWMCQEP